ncbi:MAG: glycosyltransferase [Candidatus Neomarinimicrobiota bacterium]
MIKNRMITIITPSYNRSHELKFLLESLENQKIDHNLFELIISDDGSTDGTKELIKNWKKKASFNIKYISQMNKGPGSARNHGLKNSNGELIVFIDSDCEAHPDWLKIIMENYLQNSFDACGGPDSSKDDFTTLQKSIDYSMTSFLTTGGMRGHSENMIAKFYPRTHNMAIKKAIYDQIGGFGSLRHGQDIEFSNRIRNSGARIKFIKDAIVYHRRRSSLKQFYKQVFNWGVARINLYLIDKNMLEPIHFLPTLATLSSLIILITLIVIKVPLLQILLIYFIPLSLVSLIGCLTKQDIRIFPFLLMVIPIQVIGYGLGFFKAFLLRVLLKKTEYTGFTKNYYK